MTGPSPSPRLVAGLNAARAITAFYVVLHHAVLPLVSGPISYAFRFGQEAVIIFFLMSGFVIYLNENERCKKTGPYLYRRFRRIYPTLIGALLVSAIVYLLNGWPIGPTELQQVLFTLLSVQDTAGIKPGVISDPAFSNTPLWSLSYEVAFYLAFPIVMKFARPRMDSATISIGIFSAAAYLLFVVAPNHFLLVTSYFAIWWTGAMCARAYLAGRKDWRGIASALAAMAIGLTGTVLGATIESGQISGPGLHPLLEVRHFAVAGLAVVLGYGPIGKVFATLSLRVAWLAAALASISYGLYVSHWPIMMQWNLAATLPGLAVCFIVCLITSVIIERFAVRLLPTARRTPRQLPSTV